MASHGLLELTDVSAGYEGSSVLQDVSIAVEEGEVIALLGRNGVGKTTTLRTIVGLLDVMSGSITFDDEPITGLSPHEVYSRGIGMVPEDRGIFPDLTVEENLKVPVVTDPEAERSIDELYEFFPVLEELRSSKGGNLSGGEQQMLAIARALRESPRLLILDEPSEGLAPQIVDHVASIIGDISNRGTTLLIVEQNIDLAVEMSSYVYVMDAGKIVFEGSTESLEDDMERFEQHLGVSESL